MKIIRKYDLKAFFKLHIAQKLKFNYVDYWEDRYSRGGNSGDGSYGILADYKASIINDFIKQNGVTSVIEFGCGDGNQLNYMQYPYYLGLDVSSTSITMCTAAFENDKSKNFMLYKPSQFKTGALESDLVVCLDVLYHIIDEDDFKNTLNAIFSCADKYVILYTSVNLSGRQADHILHRDICSYLKDFSNFEIKSIIENPHKDLTFADFIILERLTN